MPFYIFVAVNSTTIFTSSYIIHTSPTFMLLLNLFDCWVKPSWWWWEKKKNFFQAIEITNHPKMFLTGQARSLKWQWGLLLGGHSITTWTWFCPFLTTDLPTSTWTIDNKLILFDQLPPSDCPHSFWTTPCPKILHAIRLPLFVHHHNMYGWRKLCQVSLLTLHGP